MNNGTEKPRPSGVSRRTVVKGAAWAVPAITVASAVPAYALSGRPPTIRVESACKQPGNSCFNDYGFRKGYTFVVYVTNPNPDPIYIYTPTSGTYSPIFDVVTSSGVTFDFETAAYYIGPPPEVGDPLTTPAQAIDGNSTLPIIVNAGINGNSANISIDGYLYFAWGHTATPGNDQDHAYSPAPPAETYGEGWTGGRILFDSTPPCGTDCLPGGDETETEAG